MAYWYDDTSSGRRTTHNVTDFIMDDDSDVANLPTSTTEGVPQPPDTTLHRKVAKGSSALSIGSSSLFMLNSQDQWVQM